jgi:hypothetical protein
MLKECATYSVLLLPRRELAARGLSLREADAWIRTYNGVMEGKPAVAVIAEEAAQSPVSHFACASGFKAAAA